MGRSSLATCTPGRQALHNPSKLGLDSAEPPYLFLCTVSVCQTSVQVCHTSVQVYCQTSVLSGGSSAVAATVAGPAKGEEADLRGRGVKACQGILARSAGRPQVRLHGCWCSANVRADYYSASMTGIFLPAVWVSSESVGQAVPAREGRSPVLRIPRSSLPPVECRPSEGHHVLWHCSAAGQ